MRRSDPRWGSSESRTGEFQRAPPTSHHRHAGPDVDERLARRGHEIRDQRCRGDVELERTLIRIAQQSASLLEQDPQLGFRMRRTDMPHDPLPTVGILGDLDRCCPRRGPHPPDGSAPA